MSFDWKDLGPLIAPMAPALGGIIGGFIPFPGAALAGQALGSIIARQFGVPATPTAVANAIQTSPNEVVLAKLQASMEEAKAQWPALAEMEKAWAQTQGVAVSQVNETIRVEMLSENRHWFFTGWRPSAGWIFDFYAIVFGAILMLALLLAIFSLNPTPLRVVTEAWPVLAAFFGILAAMVGVIGIGRSWEKAKLNETAPPPVATTTTKVTKK